MSDVYRVLFNPNEEWIDAYNATGVIVSEDYVPLTTDDYPRVALPATTLDRAQRFITDAAGVVERSFYLLQKFEGDYEVGKSEGTWVTVDGGEPSAQEHTA